MFILLINVINSNMDCHIFPSGVSRNASYYWQSNAACKTSYHCLFSLHAGSGVKVLSYGPFLGTAAY